MRCKNLSYTVVWVRILFCFRYVQCFVICKQQIAGRHRSSFKLSEVAVNIGAQIPTRVPNCNSVLTECHTAVICKDQRCTVPDTRKYQESYCVVRNVHRIIPQWEENRTERGTRDINTAQEGRVLVISQKSPLFLLQWQINLNEL